jgi:uncharacterized protein (DUF305 family)
MKYRKTASALVMVACVVGVASTSATASQPQVASAATAAQVTSADEDFVMMMIPHHFQAIVMSQMAATRSSNQDLRALADRIEVEQDLEITMMQSWQGWNGLEVTDAEEAYEEMLQDPMMLHHMGMATPEQLEELSASTGAAFDQMYLELMIRHHQGAIDMIVDVIINGSDFILQQWANDMGVVQETQIAQMQEMLS